MQRLVATIFGTIALSLQIIALCLLKRYRTRLSAMRRSSMPSSSARNLSESSDYHQVFSETVQFAQKLKYRDSSNIQTRAFEKQLAFTVKRVKMWMVTIGISFLLVVLPTTYLALTAIVQQTSSSSMYEVTMPIAVLFSSILCLNSGINAIIYYVMDVELRDAMRSTLTLVTHWLRIKTFFQPNNYVANIK